MTNPNYTHLTLLVDRSGSMGLIKDDAQGGINTLISDQKNVEGKCTISFYEFDNEYNKVFGPVDIKEAPPYTLIPRGMTALIDSAHRAIVETGEFLSSLDAKDRPSKVLFVMVTDGGENSSHEVSREELKELVQRQTDEYSWNFVYIGANVDAFTEASSIGVSNHMNYTTTGPSTQRIWTRMSDTIGHFRAAEGVAASTYLVDQTNVDVDKDGNIITRTDNSSSSSS
jgi:hypothetical protein